MPLSSMKALRASSFGGTPQGGARNEIVVSCAWLAKTRVNKNSKQDGAALTILDVFISILL